MNHRLHAAMHGIDIHDGNPRIDQQTFLVGDNLHDRLGRADHAARRHEARIDNFATDRRGQDGTAEDVRADIQLLGHGGELGAGRICLGGQLIRARRIQREKLQRDFGAFVTHFGHQRAQATAFPGQGRLLPPQFQQLRHGRQPCIKQRLFCCQLFGIQRQLAFNAFALGFQRGNLGHKLFIARLQDALLRCEIITLPFKNGVLVMDHRLRARHIRHQLRRVGDGFGLQGLGAKPRDNRKGGLVFRQHRIMAGLCLTPLKRNDRLALRDLIAVAHQDLGDDATLIMLDDAAITIRADDA